MNHHGIGTSAKNASLSSSKSWPPQPPQRREHNPRPSNPRRPKKTIQGGLSTTSTTMPAATEAIKCREAPTIPSVIRFCPIQKEEELLRRIDGLTSTPDPANISNIEEIIQIHADMIREGQRLLAGYVQAETTNLSLALAAASLVSTQPSSSQTYAGAARRAGGRSASRTNRREPRQSREEEAAARQAVHESYRESIESDIKTCQRIQTRLQTVILSRDSKREFRRMIERTLPCLKREFHEDSS